MALLGSSWTTPLHPHGSFSSSPLRFSPTGAVVPPPVLLPFRCASSRSPPRFPSLQAALCSRRLLLAYACLKSDEESGLNGEPGSTVPAPSSKEVRFDLKLPRRKLIVQFTCNSCGERTERIINRLAYEKGTVFVQCAGCLLHHKLVDNLGLVVEYDLRTEEYDGDPLKKNDR